MPLEIYHHNFHRSTLRLWNRADKSPRQCITVSSKPRPPAGLAGGYPYGGQFVYELRGLACEGGSRVATVRLACIDLNDTPSDTVVRVEDQLTGFVPDAHTFCH